MPSLDASPQTADSTAYSYSAQTGVFVSGSGVGEIASTPSFSVRGRMLSLSVPSASAAGVVSPTRRTTPRSVGAHTVEGLAATPALLLGALLLDVASTPSELPCARRIAALLRMRSAIEATPVSAPVPLPLPSLALSDSSKRASMVFSSSNSASSTSSSSAAVGNDFARVESVLEKKAAEAAVVLDKPSSKVDFVRFFNTVLEDGLSAFPEIDLDFCSDVQDSHFTRRFLNPMPGSTPTQIIIMDDIGTSTGFSAGLALYLAANVKAPNRANMVYYLRGGVEALQRECPWMFQVPRIKASLPSNSSDVSNSATIVIDNLMIDETDDAFVGWGDEPIELHSPTASIASSYSSSTLASSNEANMYDSGSVNTITASLEDGMDIDGQELEDDDLIDERMVDSGIGGLEDDTIPVEASSTYVLSPTPSGNASSPVTEKRKRKSPKQKGNFHPHHRHIVKSVTKHPQTQFPHLPKTNSPTHDLRNLQHHLVSAVWYGKRVPAGDVAVPISHLLPTTPNNCTPPQPMHQYNKVTNFLHLSSCYAAADASELRSKNIRHVVRLGWGFDAFNTGLHNPPHPLSLGTSLSDSENMDFDDADWSEWEDSHDDVMEDIMGSSSSSTNSGAMSGVEGSVKFFQGLAGGMGTVSELGKMVERVRQQGANAYSGGEGVVVVKDAEERKKLRNLMGGVAKRVGPPSSHLSGGSNMREVRKKTSWRVKMYDFPIEDTPAAPIRWIFEKCCEVVEAARLLGENVLIHCHAGVSRSSTIVLAYLMRFQRLTLYEAWLVTYKARPIIRPNEGFARALQELEREIHPHLTETTLPIFWMCDSYANFMEFLELRERANRAGLLKPISDLSSPVASASLVASASSTTSTVSAPPPELSPTPASPLITASNPTDCKCDRNCQLGQCGIIKPVAMAGVIGGMVGAGEVVEDEPPVVRKGRSRGLSFGGRVG
ncbi:UNVERIFIED_CONTAM: hypothetical protein HDU68_008642 [Siphonaria sp. JEL0065]|nr:hypothetical protein HDU68_008642 [Siphonaria sp. JEL0065]